MKPTVAFIFLMLGTLLFYSCKKENDVQYPCENCIVNPPDSFQNMDTTPAIPVAVVAGTQATVSLAHSGSFSDPGFRVSIGNSGDLLDQEISLGGQPLSWSFDNLAPGTYPVRIKQTNYVSGASFPQFSVTVTMPNGSIGPLVPVRKVYEDAQEIEYSLILQVNP